MTDAADDYWRQQAISGFLLLQGAFMLTGGDPLPVLGSAAWH